MWKLLLLSTAYAATIPPGTSTVSPCLQKCFEEGSILQAANDLNNFKNIAVNINMFCQVNEVVLKCGRECPDISDMEARTAYSSFVCSEKVEEFRLIKDCMSNAPDAVDSCMQDCGLPAAALRFDSSAAALVSPTAFFDGIETTCDKHICAMHCSMAAYNKACAGAGELLKDIAKYQVNIGIERMNETVQKENDTNQQIVLNYLRNLPAKCAYMQDEELFLLALSTPSKQEDKSGEWTEKEASETTMEAGDKKQTEVPTDFQEDGAITTVTMESTLEFEPSNEPDVPIGPPEVGGTVEPVREIEGQPETDEFIIDHDGRENKQFSNGPTHATIEESTTEKINLQDNDVTPAKPTGEEEPVIVIDNTQGKMEESENSAASTAAEVKSGATAFTAAGLLLLSAVFIA